MHTQVKQSSANTPLLSACITFLPLCIQAKARVYCCTCSPSEHLSAEDKLVCNMARSGRYYGMLNARHLAPAQLSFLQACEVDAAADTSRAAALQQAAALNGSGSSSSSSACVPAEAAGHVAGLALCCTASCGSLYAELVSRWQTAEPHSTAMSNTEPATATAAAPAGSQQPAADAAGSNTSGRDNAIGSNDSLPLPDVGEFGISPWDLRWIVEELDLPAEWRSHAVYSPFQPTPWLQPAAAVSGSSDAAPASGSSSSSSADRGRCALLAAAGPAAAGLPGLWRGTYGSHGVEVVQLQLLPVAAGYNLLQQHGVFDGPTLRVSDCPRGVLLASVLHTAPPVLHPSLVVPGGLPVPDGPADAPQQQQQQSEVAGTVGPVACDTVTSRQQEQQQPQQAQKLLLVGTKVTGDRNVPAGQVTFAVDLASRSTEGAGQPLQLPPGMHSDVRVNAAGTRELVVKVRETSCDMDADTRGCQQAVSFVLRCCDAALLCVAVDCMQAAQLTGCWCALFCCCCLSCCRSVILV